MEVGVNFSFWRLDERDPCVHCVGGGWVMEHASEERTPFCQGLNPIASLLTELSQLMTNGNYIDELTE
jgi:hypothetical protein